MGSTSNSSQKKRETIEYFDLFFGLHNAFVMSFMILIILKSIILAISAHIFIIIMIAGIIYTFKLRNPFFMIFVLGPLLCGWFYSLPGIFIIPAENFRYGIVDYYILVAAILEIIYITVKLKDSALFESFSQMGVISDRGQYVASFYTEGLTEAETLKLQQEKALVEEQKEKQERDEYNKKYKRTWIISLSIISVIGYYLSYFTSFGL
ncbi:MAG: hypothetical protein ACFFD7_11075 [Candidatus Thorarchaeota archaeon]